MNKTVDSSEILQRFSDDLGRIGEKFKRIQENLLFLKDSEKLNDLFGSLDRQDQINIMVDTAKTTLKFFSNMRDEISTNLIGSSDPEHMLVLGQALRCGEQMVGDIIVSMKKKPPDIHHTEFCVNFLLVILTKLLAISIEKMEIEGLYSDIAFCVYHSTPLVEGSIDDAAFAILGEK